ncbi:MAG TPA: hypothetical protein VE621_24340 [Bryobacteraceae bacterium]|nr:hypothetical protein [Bryobacteraceae bacterium]
MWRPHPEWIVGNSSPIRFHEWRVTRSGSLNAGEPRDNNYFVL